jgi:hypothetical protein
VEEQGACRQEGGWWRVQTPPELGHRMQQGRPSAPASACCRCRCIKTGEAGSTQKHPNSSSLPSTTHVLTLEGGVDKHDECTPSKGRRVLQLMYIRSWYKQW